MEYYNLDMIDTDEKLRYYKSYLINLDKIIDTYSDEETNKINEGYKMSTLIFSQIKVNKNHIIMLPN